MGKIAKGLVAAIFCAVALVGFSGAAQAAIFTWNFSTPNGDVGSDTHTYADTSNTINIIAHSTQVPIANAPTNVTVGVDSWGPGGGFTNNLVDPTPVNLFGKNDGFGETGLGQVRLSPDNEIEHFSFIQLDVTALHTNNFTNLSMGIGSMQAGEGYYLWGSNTLGTPGLLLKTGTGLPVVQTFDVPNFNTYNFFSVSATKENALTLGPASDVLILDGLTNQPTVPEPASLSLLAMGLGGFLMRMRKRVR